MRYLRKWNYLFLLYCGLGFGIQSAMGDMLTLNRPVDLPPNYRIDPARIKEHLSPEDAGDNGVQPTKVIEKIHKHLLEPKAAKDAVIKFKLNSILLSGGTVYKKGELLKYYKAYLGKEISFQDLQNIANLITARYRQDGYVISRAIIPAQEVASGTVTIEIIEGYIATIYIEGDIGKAKAKIEAGGEKIKKMHPLQIKTLERYILLLNDITGLSVKTVLSPATTEVGAADLTLVVEQKRVAGGLSYDNRGSVYMGPDQMVGYLSIGDFVVGADNLSLQTVDTPTHNELCYLQLGYSYPIWTNGLWVTIGGNLTETRPGFTIKNFNMVGRSKNWSILVEYPLLRSRTKNLWVHGKFDWLDSYTHMGEPVLYTLFQDRIRSLRFGFSYDFIDDLKGANSLELEISKGLIHGPLDLTPSLSRIHGLSDYTKANMSITRYQTLWERLMLVAAVSGQYPFHNQLLSAEEFSFGGQQYGRAYDPSEITGDTGVAGKLELRFNTYPSLRYLDQIQCYTFYDLGAIWNNGGSNFTESAKDSGSDIGGGLRTIFNQHIYGNTDLHGHKLL